MSFSFERFGKKGCCLGAERLYVKFGKTGQMFLSTRLVEKLRVNSETPQFDVFVDREKRLLAMKFYEGGAYVVTRCPAQFGMTVFLREFNPVVSRRLPVRWVPPENTPEEVSGGDGLWVAHLDGKEVPDFKD